MPNVQCQLPVEADIQTIWRVFLDKVEHPERYMQYVTETRFVEDTDDYVIREIKTADMALTEKITLDEHMGEVKFTLVDHPMFEGDVIHHIIPSAPDQKDGLPVVQITMNWRPINREGEIVEQGARRDIEQGIADAARHIKAVAEHWEKAKTGSFPD